MTTSRSRRVPRALAALTLRYPLGVVVAGGLARVCSILLAVTTPRVPVRPPRPDLGERWAVVDVVVDGVSLAANYRAQFTKVIRTSSYETLLRRMRKHAG